jgi:hypothetical protein
MSGRTRQIPWARIGAGEAEDEDDDELLPRQSFLGGARSAFLPCVVTLAPGAAGRVARRGGRVPSAVGYCCVDTGTHLCAIDIGVMQRLEIEASDYLRMYGCSSPELMESPVFPARLMFPGSGMPELVLADFVGMHLLHDGDDYETGGHPTIALLGRTALSRLVMIYDGGQGSVTFFSAPVVR